MDEAVRGGTVGRGVRYEAVGRVGHVILDRSEVANAFDLPAVAALATALDQVEAGDVGAVLLSGSGARFCAGGDVVSFANAADQPAYLRELATALEVQTRRLSQLPVPVVAAVQGVVAGAGLSFVLNADVVVSARSTRFTVAYAGVGLTPDCGVSYLLPRVVGQARALELALTGKVLTADEAMAWGLVAQVVPDDALDGRGRELAESLAAGTAGTVGALGQAKRLIRSSWEAGRHANAADEVETISRAVESADAQRLIQRFVGR